MIIGTLIPITNKFNSNLFPLKLNFANAYAAGAPTKIEPAHAAPVYKIEFIK